MSALKVLRRRVPAAENLTKGAGEGPREALEMSPGMGTLLARAEEIQEACRDYRVPQTLAGTMTYDVEGNSVAFPTWEGDTMRLILTPLSLSQLAAKVGVPYPYLQKCLEHDKVLAGENVNRWLRRYEGELLIREYDGRARGILSGKYSVCDAPDVLDAVMRSVDPKDFEASESFLSPERLHVRLVGRKRLPVEGEDLYPALFVDSSDVGRSGLYVRFGIYKQVCTNGLMIGRGGGTLFQQRHIGVRPSEFRVTLSESLRNVPDLCQHAADLVAKARGRSYRLVEQEDVDAFLATVRGQTKLSEDGARRVVDLMRGKYGTDKWGYVNGVTEVAQEYSLERRLELEAAAGSILAA